MWLVNLTFRLVDILHITAMNFKKHAILSTVNKGATLFKAAHKIIIKFCTDREIMCGQMKKEMDRIAGNVHVSKASVYPWYKKNLRVHLK